MRDKKNSHRHTRPHAYKEMKRKIFRHGWEIILPLTLKLTCISCAGMIKTVFLEVFVDR